jgi:hypothetical protein
MIGSDDKLFDAPTVDKAVEIMVAHGLETGKVYRLGVVAADGKVLELGAFNPSTTDWRSAHADMILLVRSLASELKEMGS